jgi:glutathione S-transferase
LESRKPPYAPTNIHTYRLEQSRAQRILWLLEELKLPYDLEIFHRNKETHLAPPELKKIHGLGKSPIISITAPGSSEPVVIAESAVITEYLLDHFSNGSTLLPKRYKEGQEGKVGGETEGWSRFRYYMHYAEGSLMPLMVVTMVTYRKKTRISLPVSANSLLIASQRSNTHPSRSSSSPSPPGWPGRSIPAS